MLLKRFMRLLNRLIMETQNQVRFTIMSAFVSITIIDFRQDHNCRILRCTKNEDDK